MGSGYIKVLVGHLSGKAYSKQLRCDWAHRKVFLVAIEVNEVAQALRAARGQGKDSGN